MDKTLFDYCRYYKGEKECPREVIDNTNPAFWYGERFFVENFGNNEIEESTIHMYVQCGLAGANYDLPIFLLASLFQELLKHSDNDPMLDAVFFKEEFLPNYLVLHQK